MLQFTSIQKASSYEIRFSTSFTIYKSRLTSD